MEGVLNINWNQINTPCYVLDENLLIKNLKILKSLQDETSCSILLAQKCFSMYSAYPTILKYLKGTTASSLYEAKLGYEEMGGETHIFSPAYTEDDFRNIIKICDHIVFNSFSQWNKYKAAIKQSEKKISCGLRINPQYSEIATEMYDPCAEYSRLGITLFNFKDNDLDGIEGLHFHTMCEQNSDTLWRTVRIVDEKFGKYISKMKWINFGGGHHITRNDYDIEMLIKSINYIKEKYDVHIYLEPGEAIALNAGYLVASVLDIVDNEMRTAILDVSAACHMPDVLEMPYRPYVLNSGKVDENQYNYRLAGNTCLAGDVIGDYSFKNPLSENDKLVFTDMAIYTMVKNNTFNGIKLPSIASFNDKVGLRIIKTFGYEDFKSRLS